MAQNKNALIRYKTIDKCLQNRYRPWTLNDLVEACSDALYEYEGRDVNVSVRTVQLDIQLMRSDKLGYNAPIEVYDKKFYRYADEDYTITNIPITENDMQVLSETMEILKQFRDFSLFSEVGDIFQRLEDVVHSEKEHQAAIIHLDRNDQLKGLEHLDAIYQAILKQLVLKVNYQSFKATEPSAMFFHPYILKQFNNRWFMVGRVHGKPPIMTFALDRIQSLDYELSIHYDRRNFNADDYYRNTYGVTVLNSSRLENIELRFDASNAPYVLTKPLHHSQKLIEQHEDGSATVQVRVDQNYEFERLILGFGASVKVLKPRGLRKRIERILEKSLAQYRS